MVPTEDSGTAAQRSAAAFTPIVPVDHSADDPASETFGTALADAFVSSHADKQGYAPIPYGVRITVAAECIAVATEANLAIMGLAVSLL